MIDFMKKALKKKEWLFRSKNFNVVISYTDRIIESNWCLYVIIFDDHPLFEKACQNTCDYDIDLGNKIYGAFHQGCTYYNKQSNYVKIGCDYQHLGDERFYQSAELNNEVITDAEDLFNYFDSFNKE